MANKKSLVCQYFEHSLSNSFRFLPCKEILNLVDKLRELFKMSFVDLIKPFTNLHSSTQFTRWCCKDLSSVWFLGIQNRGKLNYLEKSALSGRKGPGGRRAYQGFLGRGVGISASRASASASSGIHFGLRHPLRGHLFGRQALTFSMPAPIYLSRFPSEIHPTALNLKRVKLWDGTRDWCSMNCFYC